MQRLPSPAADCPVSAVDAAGKPTAADAEEAVSAELPLGFAPWWEKEVTRPLRPTPAPLYVSVDNVILGTLMYSPQVRAMTDVPLIRQTQVPLAQSRFDPAAFMESKFVDTSDPVGSTLTTGGPDRWLDRNWFYSAGVRQRTALGGDLEVSQRFGYEDSNSIYFVPADQGTAKMALSYTQPLLHGAGQTYNSLPTLLADLDVNTARDQLSKDLQTLLSDVHRCYWDLYLQRAVLLQKRRVQRQVAEILHELNARREVDVLGNQIIRARAAVAGREAAVIRTEAAVSNAEAKLRNLIGDPNLLAGSGRELVPCQAPCHAPFQPDLTDAMQKALRHRPEIQQATKEVRAAGVRAEVAEKDLLPVLNLVLQTYVSGLEGNSGVFPAWVDQFGTGRPSYGAGLQFEMPWGNRAANARLQQRRLELRQTIHQLQAVTANIRTEVEVAVRNVVTAYREMVSHYHAVAADEAEIQCLWERWRLLADDQAMAGVVLDELLSAQERLSADEFELANAEVCYHTDLIELNRVTGLLLATENVTETKTIEDNLPTVFLTKGVPETEHPETVYPVLAPPASTPLPPTPPPARAVPPPSDAPQHTSFTRLPPAY